MKNRKLKIFLINIVVAVICSYFMPLDKYDKFLDYSLFLSIGFFTANSLGKFIKSNEKTSDNN